MKLLKFLIFFSFTATPFVFAAPSWPIFSPEEVAQDKYTLVAFTGSEWCPWSKKFHEEVLSNQPATLALSQQAKLLQVDFPADREDKALSQFKNRYEIKKIPCLLLLSPKGEVVAHIANLTLPADELIGQVKGFIEDATTLQRAVADPHFHKLGVDEIRALYQKAQRLEIGKFHDYFLKRGIQLDKGAYFLLQRYHLLAEKKGEERALSTLKKQILSRDPSDAFDSRFQMATIDFAHAVDSLRQHENPERALLPLLEYVEEEKKKEGKHIWEVEMMIARFLYEHRLPQKALEHAKEALQRAPVEEKKEIEETVSFLSTSSQT